MKKIWKRIYVHIIAVIIFILIPLIYLNPVLEGKTIQQLDVTKAKGMSKELKDYYEETGETALWTNSMFGGMPAYQITIFGAAPNNIFEHIANFLRLNLPRLTVDLVFLYLLGFYVLLISLRVNPWLSIVGAMAFAFSSYNFLIVEAGHVNKALAIAFMPPVLGGVVLTFKGKYVLGFFLTLVSLGVHIYYNHLQMTYYLLLMIIVYGFVQIYHTVKAKDYRRFGLASGVLILAAALAVAPNTAKLWTTYEYSQETMRGGSKLTETTGLDKGYALSWSYGTWETFTLLIPNFHGGASTGSLSEDSETYEALVANGVPPQQAGQLIQQIPTYWGKQPFTGGPTYYGAVVTFLFVAGLFLVRGRLKWWLFITSILAIMLSWGENFPLLTNLFYENAPLYNKFRAVASILVIGSICFPLLGFLTLKELSGEDVNKKGKQKALNLSLYITGGICLFFILLGGAMFSFQGASDDSLQAAGYPAWLIDAIQDDRAALLRADAFRSLIFIALTFGLCWAYLKGKLTLNKFIPVIGILLLLDMWAVDKRYLNNNDFKPQRQAREIQPTQANLQILEDKDPNYRVFNLTRGPFQESSTSYFHKSIGGYHGAKLSRYQDLIERHLSKQNMAVLNMLNTRYFIVPGANNQPVVKRNPNALGNAWFVDSIRLVSTANEEIDALNNFKPATTAIVHNEFDGLIDEVEIAAIDSLDESYIELIEYAPDHLTYRSDASHTKLAVFSEIYYNNKKGWNAYIDGQLVPHLRVNYVLRGLVVPKGAHTIEFKFEPRSFYAGQRLSLIGSIIAGLAMIGAMTLLLMRKSKSSVSD